MDKPKWVLAQYTDKQKDLFRLKQKKNKRVKLCSQNSTIGCVSGTSSGGMVVGRHKTDPSSNLGLFTCLITYIYI